MKRFYAVRFLFCFGMGVLLLNAAMALSKIPPESVLSVFHQPQKMQLNLIPQLFTLDFLTQRVAAAGVCSPYGDPVRSTGAYYVCTENKYRIGMAPYDEIRLSCKEDTAHPGAQWHLWCNADENRCGCNKHDVEAGTSTCCGRTAAAHCTDANPGRPGGNGCATWNDEGH